MPDALDIEVVYAGPDRQWRVPLKVPAGTTVIEAIEASGLRSRIPMLALDPTSVGVFGRRVAPETPLRDGDRVEIYRPLRADPKELRRARAAEARRRR